MKTYDVITNEDGKLKPAGSIDYDCLPNYALYELDKLGKIYLNTCVKMLHAKMLEKYGEGKAISEDELESEITVMKKEIFEKDKELKESRLEGEDLFNTRQEFFCRY